MQTIIAYAVLGIISFLLHIVWERLHIVLYTGYEAMQGVVPVYVFATIGDVFYTLLAILTIAALRRSTLWFTVMRSQDYATLAVVGLTIAVFVETKALVYGKWEYTDAMPMLWIFGLSPLVQMTVLLPLSVYITTVVLRVLNR